MSLRVTCQFCEAKLKVRADKSGQQFKCPSCRNTITAPAASSVQSRDSATSENSNAEMPDEGSEIYNFAEEFDLEGLLPESDHSSEDLSRLPPARKLTSKSKKDKAGSAKDDGGASRAKPQNQCTVCSKQLDPGVRYCTGCGHNNFDADAAAVDAHFRIQSRMERLTASLGVARLLKIFSRMFR